MIFQATQQCWNPTLTWLLPQQSYWSPTKSTLPETNSEVTPEAMDDWKTFSFPFGAFARPIFRGKLAVRFREGIWCWKEGQSSSAIWCTIKIGWKQDLAISTDWLVGAGKSIMLRIDRNMSLQRKNTGSFQQQDPLKNGDKIAWRPPGFPPYWGRLFRVPGPFLDQTSLKSPGGTPKVSWGGFSAASK